MFSAGQTVLYGPNGVCKIDGITQKNVGGMSLDYYVLIPICSSASTVYVPTKNENLVKKMRFTLSSDEINTVLSDLPEVGEWNNNKLERADSFKAIIARGQFSELVSMVRLLKSHEKKQNARGKHLHIIDERLLKEAEKMVYEEISYVLGVDRSEAISLVSANIS